MFKVLLEVIEIMTTDMDCIFCFYYINESSFVDIKLKAVGLGLDTVVLRTLALQNLPIFHFLFLYIYKCH